MVFAIPLAWLQLVREKVRLCIALAGIAFAVILMMMQLGFRDALFDSSVTFHASLNTDIVLISPQSTTLIAMKSFARNRLYQALGVPGVASVSPLYLNRALWRNPETRGTRQIFLIGFDPADQVFNLPGVLRNQDQIKQADVVLFDQASRAEFGPVASELLANRPVETEVAGRRIKVGGLFQLGASFGADGNLITSDLNLLRILGQSSLGLIDIGLIKVEPGTDVAQVVRRLSATLPDDVVVLSKAGFIQFEKSYWQNSTSIGFVFTLGTIMGFIVGTVIVYQILYTDVSDHLAEYATLKAMGYKSTFLFSVVIQEGDYSVDFGLYSWPCPLFGAL